MKLFIPLAILLAACGTKSTIAIDPVPVDASPDPSPAVTVVASPSTVAPGGSVTLAVTTTNFTVVDPRSGPAPKPNEGHFHYYLDDEIDYTAGWTPSVTIRTSNATSLGTHTVRFVLVTNVHQDVTPTIDTTVTFTVQ